MILVLCDEADRSALWAMDVLRERGLSPTMLTGETLASVVRWHHRLGTAGVECELSFPGGAHLCSREIRGVLNRLPYIPSAWQRRIGGPDREYALQEIYAFILSWLHALPGPVLNPPTPQGLCGNWRHPAAWAALAVSVGLPARPFRQTSADSPLLPSQIAANSTTSTVYVVGTRAIGHSVLISSYAQNCVRLAEKSLSPLLGIDFALDGAGCWQMLSASVMPDLASGGEELADALATALAA